MEFMTVDINLELAKRRVAAIKGFYIHLGAFVMVMCTLLVIDAFTGPGWWVQWPLVGWGIGLLVHAFGVFGSSPDLLANWEIRKIASEKRRLDEISAKGTSE